MLLMNNKLKFSLEESVYFLKHQQAIEKTVLLHLAGLIPAIADWKIKQTLGFDLWHDSIHANDMRHRIKELRILRPDKDLHSGVELLWKLLETAPSAESMLEGIYNSIKPSQVHYYKLHKDHILPINDAPSMLLIQQIRSAKIEQIETMHKNIQGSLDWCLTDTDILWLEAFKQVIESLFSNIFSKHTHPIYIESLKMKNSSDPILPFNKAIRPKRFKINNIPKLPENLTAEQETIYHFSNFVQEMQAAETVGSILYETPDMPWEYTLDLARHLWDEIRHSMMGEVRLKELGLSLEDIEFAVGNYEWRQTIDPVRRFATLTYIIEAEGFPLKHHRLKKHLDAEDFISAQTYLYDITDETTHVQNGKKWVSDMMRNYHIEMNLDEFIEECRAINDKNTFSPLQKKEVMNQLIRN
jgi:hypothetical protein